MQPSFLRAVRRLSAAPGGGQRRRLLSSMPPSPITAYRASLELPQLRTGLTRELTASDVDRTPAHAFRSRVRSGEWGGPTVGCAPGFVQANFVALPAAYASDFLTFCLRNPRACPLLDVTSPGDPIPRTVAPNADLRSDIPRYRVWRDGLVAEEVPHLDSTLWDDRTVGFLLGCSFSWEHELHAANLTPRQMEEGRNVPMYKTNVSNAPVGPFAGQLVVSMRPYLPKDLEAVAQLTGRYPGAHGAPIHWGDPAELGLSREQVCEGEPDWGEQVTVRQGEEPVFWACGVTPQAALAEARIPFAITHAPGHMLVCDVTDRELSV